MPRKRAATTDSGPAPKKPKRKESSGLPSVCYHLIELPNWDSIKANGLFPASHLMDRAGVRGAERAAMENARREKETKLSDGTILRDNKPLPEAALERCLVGMTASEWYTLLNSKVFFWLDLDRLERQRKAGSNPPQVILVLDTAKLVDKYGESAAVTAFNSGNAMRAAARRNAASFVPVPEFEENRWASETPVTGKKRPDSHEPVELAVSAAMADVMSCAIAACKLARGEAVPSPAALLTCGMPE